MALELEDGSAVGPRLAEGHPGGCDALGRVGSGADLYQYHSHYYNLATTEDAAGQRSLPAPGYPGEDSSPLEGTEKKHSGSTEISQRHLRSINRGCTLNRLLLRVRTPGWFMEGCSGSSTLILSSRNDPSRRHWHLSPRCLQPVQAGLVSSPGSDCQCIAIDGSDPGRCTFASAATAVDAARSRAFSRMLAGFQRHDDSLSVGR